MAASICSAPERVPSKSIRCPGLPAVVVDLDDCIGLVQLRQRRARPLVCGRVYRDTISLNLVLNAMTFSGSLCGACRCPGSMGGR